MAFTRPNQPQRPSAPSTKPNPITQGVKPQKKIIPSPSSGGGNQGGGSQRNDGGGNGGGSNKEPSPWLMGESPEKIDPSASFVEYLRWMRSPSRIFVNSMSDLFHDEVGVMKIKEINQIVKK